MELRRVVADDDFYRIGITTPDAGGEKVLLGVGSGDFSVGDIVIIFAALVDIDITFWEGKQIDGFCMTFWVVWEHDEIVGIYDFVVEIESNSSREANG